MNVPFGQGLLVRSLLLVVAALGLFGGGAVEAPRAGVAAAAVSGSGQVGRLPPAPSRTEVPTPGTALRAVYAVTGAQSAAGAALPPSTGLLVVRPSSFAPPVRLSTALSLRPFGVALGRAPPVTTGT